MDSFVSTDVDVSTASNNDIKNSPNEEPAIQIRFDRLISSHQ